MMVLPEVFNDHLRVLGARMEMSELPGEIRRLLMFVGARPSGAQAPSRVDDAA